MTRSFGDQSASEVGVIAVPEITEWTLSENDKFIILASDGIWEVMSSKEAVDVVFPFYKEGNAEKAAQTLVREASERWEINEHMVDDITCIIIFLSL